MYKEYIEVQYINGNTCRLEAGEEAKGVERAKKNIKEFLKETNQHGEIANIDNQEFFGVNTMTMHILTPSVFVTPIMVQEE